MDTPDQSPQVLSLCSGMCGIERGIERAIGKLNIAAYVEIEAFIIQNLTALMEAGVLGAAPVWPDLKTFPAEAFHGKLHGIIGGYPCQPFSVAGKQKGSEDPRHLWPHIQRIIEASRPIWCFFENVEGHLKLGYSEVYQSLRAMGYTIEADLFTAAEVGAPHKRTRLFILAIRTSELGNAQHHGYATGTERRGHAKNYERCKKGKNLAEQLEGASELANTCKPGFQRSRKQHGFSESNGETQISGICSHVPNAIRSNGFEIWNQSEPRITRSNGEGWPFSPGPHQHEWEAQRTIESGLGSSAHGYNFREDLLRMYGNGVVEQTAELAWVSLWKTLLTNLKLTSPLD